MAKYCRNCGSANDDNAMNCGNCGTQLDMNQQYQQPQYQQPQYQQQYQQYQQPMQGGVEQKSKLVAGLLQIFLGSFGVGRFYLGYTGMAVAQILVTWLTCGLGAIWPLIDGIMIITGSVKTDAKGVPLKD